MTNEFAKDVVETRVRIEWPSGRLMIAHRAAYTDEFIVVEMAEPVKIAFIQSLERVLRVIDKWPSAAPGL